MRSSLAIISGCPLGTGRGGALLRPSLLITLLGTITAISACVGQLPRGRERDDSRALSDSNLARLTYSTPVLGHRQVTLRDGEWEDDSTPLRRERVALLLSTRGTLASQEEWAVVVLLVDPGATGRFFEVLPVRAAAGRARAGRATELGDRIRPESLWVSNGRAHLRIVTHDTADALCCPTRREVQRYRLIPPDSLALEDRTLIERLPADPGGG